LDRVPQKVVREARRLRSALGSRFEPRALNAALGELLLADVFVTVQSFGAPGEQAPPAGVVHLASIDGALRVAIESGPELTNAVLARLLERGAKISDPNATESAALRGAFAALLIEAARRAGGAIVWRAVPDAPRTTGGVALDATVFIDEKPYGVRIVASEDPKPTHDFADPVRLRDLDALPLTLAIVAGVSAGARDALAALAVGDVWLPGEGWFCNAGNPSPARLEDLLVSAAVAGPASERGVEVGRSEDGRIVLRGSIVVLAADRDAHETTEKVGTMSDSDPTLDGLVLDAPVVVRVEVGSVTLSARQWAELRAGDVLETGVRLAEPVVLRIAGREVARGELVNVDGELGVRIRELSDPGRAP
jgi:type III secretion system YscQ/HrcQ family protein